MQKEHVPNVCRVGTHNKNDFDEVMPVVQISIGNCEIMDVLLDGGFGVNIISKHLRRKLGLKKPQSTPFYGKDGRSKEGTTTKVDTKLQN